MRCAQQVKLTAPRLDLWIVTKDNAKLGKTDSAFHNNLKCDSVTWGYFEKSIRSHSIALELPVNA